MTKKGWACFFFIYNLAGLNFCYAQSPSFNYPGGQRSYTTGTAIETLSPSVTGGAIPPAVYGEVKTLAGNGSAGSKDGTGSAATLSSPVGIAIDAAGNLYVTNYEVQGALFLKNLIRKITPQGVVTTFAGTGAQGSADGPAGLATFSLPGGAAIDGAGNIYIADAANNIIRKITPTGAVNSFAGSGAAGSTDGVGKSASFNTPTAIAIDKNGNLYVADYGNNLIRKIEPNATVTTLAGGGPGTAVNGPGSVASFKNPQGVAVDAAGNVYVADAGNNQIRKITSIGLVSTFAGSGVAGAEDGAALSASFSRPSGIAVDQGGTVFVADAANNLIRKITPAGQVSVLAGSGTAGGSNSIAQASSFNYPEGLAIDAAGILYVGDKANNMVRRVAVSGYTISPALPAGLNFDSTTGTVTGVPIIPADSKTYTVTGYNSYGSSTGEIVISVTGPSVSNIVPPSISYETPKVYKANSPITALVPQNKGGEVPPAIYSGVSTLAGSGAPGRADNTGTVATFNTPEGIGSDAAGNIYVADAVNNLIRKIAPDGAVTTLAGNGTAGTTNGAGSAASFNRPTGITTDKSGNVYVADAENSLVRKIETNGQVSTYATGFNNPSSLVFNAAGDLFIADMGSNQIKRFSKAGLLSTFAGNSSAGSSDGQGAAASFSKPAGITIDAAGNLYVADSGNNLIRMITPSGQVTTVAGNGAAGSGNGAGKNAGFNNPVGIAVDFVGRLYIGDTGNHLVRMITPAGVVTTLAGAGKPGRQSGQGVNAGFNMPKALIIDDKGNISVADAANNVIRRISINGYTINPELPKGLIFDERTGSISGTPASQSAAADYLVTAYNSAGSGSFIINLEVEAPLIFKVQPPLISYITPQNYVINKKIIQLEPANSGGDVPKTVYGEVSLFAGSGAAVSADGAGTSAGFKKLSAVTTDYNGNVYFIDNNVIRKLSKEGLATTLAGSADAGFDDGQGAFAKFNQPSGLAADAKGNIFVADTKNQVIRMVTSSGQVTTVAGTAGVSGWVNGPGRSAKFKLPRGVTVDQDNNVYIADAGNNAIRKFRAGYVSDFAGSAQAGAANGNGSAASFSSPVSVTADLDGNVYVADNGNNMVRKITTLGVVTTLAGNFNNLLSVSADKQGNIYVTDAQNNAVRKITPGGEVTRFTGKGSPGAENGPLANASFNNPEGLSIDIFGNLYVADVNNFTARKITTTGFSISPALPEGLVFDGSTGFISGTPTAISPKTTYTITAYNTGGQQSAKIVLQVSEKPVPAVLPPEISYEPAESFKINQPITPLIPTMKGGPVPDKIFGFTTTLAGSGFPGAANGPGGAASFNQPFGVATDKNGNVFVVDNLNNMIRKITAKGEVSILAGNGTSGSADGLGAAASFSNPTGIAIDLTGNLYVADVRNNLIRKITQEGLVTTLAGNLTGGFADGYKSAASFSNPSGIAVDKAGNVYVADLSNHRIRKISPGGEVTTLAGSGLNGTNNGLAGEARFLQPYAVAVDADQNVYVADIGNNVIRKISAGGRVTTLAGSGKQGAADGVGEKASFYNPFGIAIDEYGNLFITDSANELIRKVAPNGYVTTVAGNGTRGNANGKGSESSFFQPTGITSDEAGNVFVADEFNHQIRQVVTVSNFTIDKPLPEGLKFDPTTGVISGTPTETSEESSYLVTAYNAGGSGNYRISFIVHEAPPVPQVITFENIQKKYGDANFNPGAKSTNPAIPVKYISSNDDIASVNKDGTIHIKGVGTVSITATQDGNANYIEAASVSVYLTIKPATLTITAEDKRKMYLTANPTFTYSYLGFINGEGTKDLTKLPVVITSVDRSTEPGEYEMLPSGAEALNYDFVYVAGRLKVDSIPPLVTIPNTFTPNGDGVNDLWELKSLLAYNDCTVSVFNRYGQMVYRSVGYAAAWDGTMGGKELSAGTYYYIIDLKNATPQLSGPITLIR